MLLFGVRGSFEFFSFREMIYLFKLLKTKKGFSLVELMIVVVIMAILVAIAVPIYNAVSEGFRAKTCISNQRQIYGAVNNYLTANQTRAEEGTISITTNSEGKPRFASYTGISESLFNATKSLFKTVPCCPVSATGEITIYFELDEAGFTSARTVCVLGGEKHVFDAAADEDD